MAADFDRYVSFIGSDWEAKSAQVFACLQRHFDLKDSPFWPYFLKQRALAHRQGLDDLRVLHNFMPTLRELFENLGDAAHLTLLEALEETCM